MSGNSNNYSIGENYRIMYAIYGIVVWIVQNSTQVFELGHYLQQLVIFLMDKT